jgi:L-lactate dehydrogenase (cytochrome)
MKGYFIPDYPSVVSLKCKAKRRIPSFAFEYLDGGCNEELNLRKNTDDIRTIELEPRYIAEKTIDSGDGTNRL